MVFIPDPLPDAHLAHPTQSIMHSLLLVLELTMARIIGLFKTLGAKVGASTGSLKLHEGQIFVGLRLVLLIQLTSSTHGNNHTEISKENYIILLIQGLCALMELLLVSIIQKAMVMELTRLSYTFKVGHGVMAILLNK